MLDKTKIIPSVVQFEQVKAVIASKCERVNLMVGNINNIGGSIEALHKAGKRVFVHIEMIGGIGRDKDAVRYMADTLKADGIIATKSVMLQAAKSCALPCVQRFFAIDTGALKTALKTIASTGPDEVEVMPGLMPDIIAQIKASITVPLIVGGLIKSEEAANQAFASGADYVSTGYETLW